MTLMLEIVGSRANQLGEAARRVFTADGGTIGRQRGCEWIIPDPYISALHARIHYRDGHYLLEDLSSNGVFVKSRENRLRSGELYFLQDGDRIFLDALELRVTIPVASERTESMRVSGAVAGNRGKEPKPASSVSSLTLPLVAPSDAVADALMGRAEAFLRADTQAISKLELDLATEADDLTSPTSSQSGVRKEGPSPEPDSAAAAAGSVDFTQLLLAAGLPEASITPELSQNLGNILQVVVDGLLDSLRARESIKSEIGVAMTTFKPVDNNPLKFSANAADALHNLFVKRNAAYLTPVEAFREAFRDLRAHQSAMLAAVQQTLAEVRSTIDPKHLTQEFDRQLKESSLLPVPARLRYWDLFCEKFADQGSGGKQGIDSYWSAAFSRAYVAQFERLKAADPIGKNRR